MIKKYTTSAQKTVSVTSGDIIKILENALSDNNTLSFKPTKRANIKEAKLGDGSKLVIAAFEKENGKALAMIDFKDLPASRPRAEVQSSLRKQLDSLFAGYLDNSLPPA